MKDKIKKYIRTNKGFIVFDNSIIHNEENGLMKTNLSGLKFYGVSLVEADIKSKWQAHFLQVFPISEVYDKLPATHESDKEILKKSEEERVAKKTFNTLIEGCV